MQFGVAEAVDHWARYRPSTIATYAGGTPYTYAALNGLAGAVAAEVEAFAADQPRVAVALGSKVPLLAALLGVLRTGRSIVLVNTGLPKEVIDMNLHDAAVKALLHDESQAHLGTLVPCSVAVPPRALPLASLPPLTLRGSRDEWGVLFSSGTTGVPKGIVRDHESMVTELVGWCLELGLNRHTRFYIGRPIYYTGGLVLTLATLLVGGTAILNDYHGESFEDTWVDYQRTLEGMSIDFAFFIPDQLRVFLRAAAAQRPRTARTVLTMGGPITGVEKLQVVAALGCEIVESWGNSESLGTITDSEDVNTRPDSIGRPFLTDEMCVVDDECRPVQPNVLGRLAGGESAGFLLYCNRPDDTALAKRPPLIISEDIGYADENGFFYLRGRLQDSVVLSDGSTVFLQELERELSKSPMIRDCCIVARPSGDAEGHVLVALVPAAPQEASALTDAVRERLPSRITVGSIRILDELPRLPSGKVDRLAVQRGFDPSD